MREVGGGGPRSVAGGACSGGVGGSYCRARCNAGEGVYICACANSGGRKRPASSPSRRAEWFVSRCCRGSKSGLRGLET